MHDFLYQCTQVLRHSQETVLLFLRRYLHSDLLDVAREFSVCFGSRYSCASYEQQMVQGY